MAQTEDMPGLLGDLIRIGVVETVGLADATLTAKLGDIVSPSVPWLELAGGFRTWCPPTVGEQILLLCPEGDIAHGVALRGLYSNAFPAPASDGRARILMPDGSTIDYDPEGHVLAITLAGGKLTINAPEGVAITGNVTVTGKVDVSETVTASDDVIGGGKSLKGHKHSGVQAGSALSGAPA
ncbi:phage baseplate assembly protein V [Sphingobium sp. B11D3D]|uniref:phage baseplate assembly protein V n=1 Tax=Sphingobium sp. B11D3D TaxID=2940576 RepID=UPI0022250433|nr:phage baseplate assembly protein V [Sphingobium sp. B11D3D]MCW2370194.1 phage baseplate assembly protein V [Sphingobium sp. B11D3D]